MAIFCFRMQRRCHNEGPACSAAHDPELLKHEWQDYELFYPSCWFRAGLARQPALSDPQKGDKDNQLDLAFRVHIALCWGKDLMEKPLSEHFGGETRESVIRP